MLRIHTKDKEKFIAGEVFTKNLIALVAATLGLMLTFPLFISVILRFKQVVPFPSFSCWYRLQVICCCSIAQSCPILCDPVDCITPGFLTFTISRTCWNSCPLSRWCHPTISSSVTPFSFLQSYPTSGFFLISQLFTSGGLSIGTSASVSVLPMDIQGWFPLGLTVSISLQSEGRSSILFSTEVQKHQFFSC